MHCGPLKIPQVWFSYFPYTSFFLSKPQAAKLCLGYAVSLQTIRELGA